jgi:hypothetical protein
MGQTHSNTTTQNEDQSDWAWVRLECVTRNVVVLFQERRACGALKEERTADFEKDEPSHPELDCAHD